jgi:hypothetical protein
MRYITFRNCYNFLILDFVIVPISVIVREAFKTLTMPLLILQLIITFLLNLYIYSGYIKYADIANEKILRKIMFLVVGLYSMSMVLSAFHMYIGMTPLNYLNYLSPMPIAFILIFYSFRLIKNEEQKFFKMLSNLYLCTFLLSILGGGSILVLSKNFTASTKWIYILPFFIGGAVIAIMKFYFEVKLFRWLSSKYDETNRLTWKAPTPTY